MIAFLLAIPGKIKLYLALAGAFVLAVGVAMLRGYAAGKEAQRAAQARAIEKANRKVRENRVEAGVMTEEELEQELARWQRGQ